MSHYYVQSFYFFQDLPEDQLKSVRAWLIGKAQSFDVLGLVILGTEGVNTTMASLDERKLNGFVASIKDFFSEFDFDVKKSESDKAPFRKFVVKLRPEIVTLGKPEFVPGGSRNHVTPDQWNQLLAQDDVVVIDTRNDYEIEIGTFEKALDLGMKEFTEFPEKIKKLDSDKEKPHLIFCTGGIRCEKAIYEMENQGYKNVYQLDGGILNYLEQHPEGKFNGECFVFDSRVAVNEKLKPSEKYSLCPQCGEVGSIEITCKKCDEPSKLCKKCIEIIEDKPEYETCSKNCRYHYSRDPKSKGPQQKQFYHN